MDIKALEKTALSVRALSMDAIEKANAGHPGLPLGAAELGAVLYGELLRHDPSAPDWTDRDRFILSAGHGSMFLYSMLYLSGYRDITLDDIKTFRQVGSRCAGHPEYGSAAGIEMTTGPLGQGAATAVGMAIAETMLAARFNTEKHTIVNHYTYAFVGDGCLQEGVSAEAASLAGHLKLGKLILFYDSNKITIDGSTDLSFTEDTAKRYEAYGWQVLKGSMYDFEEIAALTAQAKAETSRPSIIILKSVIGKGTPNKQDTADAHGAPLGAEEAAAAKRNLGIPGDFYVAPEAVEYFKAKQEVWKKVRAEWQSVFDAWSAENPDKRKEWDNFHSGKALPGTMPAYQLGDKVATRTASNKALIAEAAANANLVGGSADLKGPNAVGIPDAGVYSPANRSGRYIHYGIREFAMAAVSNGIQLHGGFRSFCATFMVFSDYLRPALRLSALMKQPVIYVLTHDSIFVGEDGPTHQPIEHVTSLRVIPNMRVLRPADAEETCEAWAMAMERSDGPTALALTRQTVPVIPKEDPDWKNTIRTGAYVVKKASGQADLVIIAAGSEVSMALAAAEKVPEKNIQVVSMISRELFASQPKTIQDAIVPPAVRAVCCEAGAKTGWERWAKDEDIFSIDRFGESGPGGKVAEYLGFTADALAALIRK
ncbi:transketolase [Treponema sp. OttesenSCG-928-L16]|nr:transketolase [Treponema sp. OttesenSCG-928-L16]